MIQFFVLVPRAEGVSPGEFRDHWRHPHATVERMVPTVRSYVLGHRVHTDLLGPEQAEFDGVTEVSFDTVDDAANFGTEPFYRRHVEPDEPVFADVSRLAWVDTEEEVLVPRPAGRGGDVEGGPGHADHPSYADAQWLHLDRPVSAKLMQFVRPGGDPDWGAADDSELGPRLGAFRQVRNHPVRAVHGDDPPFLGVRQWWWPTVTAFETGVRADRPAFDRLLTSAGDALTMLVVTERYLR